MKKKTFALLLSLVLVFGVIAGGTLAWLTAKSDTVVNTFTTSDINVKLAESKGVTTTDGKSFKMVPGKSIEKDPKAWVVAGSEDCYLFVKLDWENNENKQYLDWDIAEDWRLVPNQMNVYYRVVTASQMSNDNGATNSYPVLKNNTVTVSGNITKGQMNAFTDATLPKLTVTAYASQLYNNNTQFTPEAAWSNVGIN